MANDDKTIPLPDGKNYKRSSAEFLPQYFRTNANKKFLQASLDQFVSDGVVEKINGFVGKKEAKAVTINDTYLAEVTDDRDNYQFEPYAVYEDSLGNTEFSADYLDYIGLIKTFRGNTDNHSKLNEQEFYAWNPHINFDKFTNFREYYWLPNGPQEVPVKGQSRDIVSTYQITTVTDDDNTALLFTPDGKTRNPEIKLFRGQKYIFEVNTDGHPITISSDRKFIPILGTTDKIVNVSATNNIITKIFDQTLTAWVEGIDWQNILLTDNDVLSAKNSLVYEDFDNNDFVETLVDTSLDLFKDRWNLLVEPYVGSLDFLAIEKTQLSTTEGNDTIIVDGTRYDRAAYVADANFTNSTLAIKNTIYQDIVEDALASYTKNDRDIIEKALYDAGQLVLDALDFDYTIKLYSFSERTANSIQQDDTNVSFIYNDGVKLSPVSIEGDTNDINDFVFDGYIENGIIEFTVPDNAPNELYFVSQTNIDTSCRLRVYDIEENTEIDIEKEIIGKKTYTTSDGWNFSNGMKIYFIGNVTPANYSEGFYYVEGVGDSINLVPVNELSVPAIFTQDTQVPFDTNGFDRVPFSDALSFAGTKDYIVINRSSADRNGWTRYNRWFHKDVILQSAEINSQDQYAFDESARAKRPIIEFESGLKLYQHGTKAKQIVDLVDDYTSDVFSIIEGSIGYNIDGIDLAEGMRVLFTADPDPLVNGKIYEVKFIDHNNKKDRISLVETSDTLPTQDETVLIKTGVNYAGRMFYYNDGQWQVAQDKNAINQVPKFDLYDEDGISYSDLDTYPLTTFKGNNIFSYQVGEGVNDTELGFPIVYKNLVNSGDILFDFNMLKDSYTYEVGGVKVNLDADLAYVKKYDLQGDEFSYQNSWKKANTKSSQYVIRKFTGRELTNSFPVDFFDNSAEIADLKIIVYHNNKLLIENVDYEQININKTRFVVFETAIEFDDIVIIKGKSKTTKNKNGYYETPHNFERNPLNNNITEFTYGQVADHVEGLIVEVDNFVGSQPGRNNLRDLGNVYQYGRKFVKHSGPLNIPLVNLARKDSNIVNAIRYAKKEYSKFKRDFVQIAETLGVDTATNQHVNLILAEIKKNKRDNMPFYNSDMIGSGGYKRLEYTVLDIDIKYYALSTPFAFTVDNRKAVYVYLNGEQLCYGVDYTLTTEGFAYITKTIAVDDTIEIHEYETTEASYIPPTPTKLGMFPAYKPEKFVDSTYADPVSVIRGHDGSITIAYDDFRDDLLLELERRIYNNIKVTYDTSIFDIHDYVGGEYRDTGISKEDLDNVLITDFVSWLTTAGNVDYTDNSFVQERSTLTYNYSSSVSPKGNRLPGFWRGVYIDSLDTDSPNLRPWEILGFSVQPSWWETQYGPAPYTKDNLILWKDIEGGIVREPGKEIKIRKKYIRPGLTSNIPVDESGRIRSPLDSSYSREFSFVVQRDKLFKFGDVAPTESAWRRSSEYPFALIVALLANRPAAVSGLLFDRSRITRNKVGNLIYTDTKKAINLENVVFPYTEQDSVVNYTAGLINYIESYIRSSLTASYEEYRNTVINLDNKLGFKVGGFADKSKLKLVLDSRTPLNKGNVFVPFENYSISLKKSSPIDIVSYSGVIIEKLPSGYRVSGYDQEDPFFLINKHAISAGDPVVNVGGISESFLVWDSAKIFDKGRIVEYLSAYYRVNETHTSNDTFDTSKFSKLAELPVVGGVSAVFRKNFTNTIDKIDYGTVFPSVQEVVDFLLSYDAYLKSIGFTFDFNNSRFETIENFNLLAREFMFFTTENWANSTIITLSPGANQLKFDTEYSTVDDIYDNFLGYTIKQIDGRILQNNFTNTIRVDGNSFGLFPTNTTEGIFFAKLALVQKEHVVLIDNNTVFNDTIYDPESGYRQERIKVVGYRTDAWDGSLNIPGFIYDQAKFTIWEAWRDYDIAEIVKYKEFYYTAKSKISGSATFDPEEWNLLAEKPEETVKPNFDYRANQFIDFYDLDTDNFDSEQQRLAQHLIGYQKRDYLSNIIVDDVSQYKFYQGFIQDKGTKNSLTKLFDKLGSADKDSLEFFEEWAFRNGQYGATSAYKEVEYALDESKFRIEPQLVELVQTEDTTRTDLVFQYPVKDVYIKEPGYNHAPFPVKYTDDEVVKTGGYVSLDQADIIAKTPQDIINLDVNTTDIGNIIWVPEYKNSWNIYEVINAPLGVEKISKTDTGFEVIFDRNCNFVAGDIIGLRNVSTEIDGYRFVASVSQNRATFNDTVSIEDASLDLSDSSLGSVLQLLSKRVADLDAMNSLINLYGLPANSKFWVDNIDDKFAVYESSRIWSGQENLVNREAGPTSWAESFAVNGYNTALAVADKNSKVYLYKRLSSVVPYVYNQTLAPESTLYDADSNFGESIEYTKDGNWLIIGAPTATNVKTKYKGEIAQIAYTTGDIVSDGGLLFKAIRDINFDSSTINTQSQDWEQVTAIEADEEGTGSTFNDQGAIHIYRRQTDQSFALYQTIVSPYPQADEKFGIAIKSSFDPNTLSTRLYVRSEKNNGRLYFLDLPNINDTFGYSRDPLYRGKFNSAVKYITGEIVEYNTTIYTASQTVPAGNEFNVTQWNTTESNIDRLGYVPIIGDDAVAGLEDSTAFDSNFRIAENFDVSDNGEVLVLTSLLSTDEYKIVVYRKTGDRFALHQTINAETNDIDFGHSVAINSIGNIIAIGATLADDQGTDTGKVFVYEYNTSALVFEKSQELVTPQPSKNERFGWQVDFSEDKLAVTGINGENSFATLFDTNETYFDSRSTEFVEKFANQLQIYVFEKLFTKFVYAETVDYAYYYTDQNGNRVAAKLNDTSNPKILFNKNHIVLGLPLVSLDDTDSIFGLVADLTATQNADSWQLLSRAKDFVDYEKLKGVFLYDKVSGDLITYLDVIDPIQGKIANIAEQEIFYKTPYDPAVYSNGSTDTGIKNPWTNNYIGKLWWDLSTVKWLNPYQGNITSQNNKWNKIIEGFSVDVYEWVESPYLPSKWDEIADTTEGLSQNISGTTLYGDSKYSVAQTYDAVAGRFNNRYFFWVRNSKLIPNVSGRNASCETVINLIADPKNTGYRFISLFNEKEFALHNVRSLISGKDTIIHFDYADGPVNLGNVHSEYSLLTENDETSEPNNILVDKWFDSLVGYDANLNKLPDLDVSPARRYGILNEPLQTMFVNKTEALKQIVERVNLVLLQNLIVDDFDLSPLDAIDPLPSDVAGKYDEKIDNEGLLRFVGTSKIEQAQISLTTTDGRISSVTIENSGRGYKDPSYTAESTTRNGPSVEILGTGSGAVIKTEINNLGQITNATIINAGNGYTDEVIAIVRPFTVLVTNDSSIGGFWATYNYNKTEQEWNRQSIQSYDTTFYWQYRDWYKEGFSSITAVDHFIPASYALDGLNANINDIVKIENIGSGGWLLLQKINDIPEVDYTVNYQTVGRQNGTIQLSKLLYNNTDSGFDNQIYDSVLYDREPVNETRIILRALQTNIFVDQLKIEWNKLFFSSIRYVLAEQPTVDWVFKSAFIKAKHNVGELDQRVTFRNDNLENYQDYVAEVKPYSSKIREYVSGYEKVDPTETSVTDFDLQPRYSESQRQIIPESLQINQNVVGPLNSFVQTYPQKHWLDNLGFEITELAIANGGTGWSSGPVVTISGGGGPTIEGKGIIARGVLVDIEIDTSNAFYTSAPVVTLNGSQAEDSEDASVIAILGNSKVRSTHVAVKFDRTYGTDINETLYANIDKTETFTGNAGISAFELEWPMDLTASNVTVTVDNVESLSSEYTISNKLDTTKGFTRYKGVITFFVIPQLGANIQVSYKIAPQHLHAADRIRYHYNPSTGMLGKDLSQLMDGVDYSGVQIDTIALTGNQGFETTTFGVGGFDTFDTTFNDIKFTADGSTQLIELDEPLEAGVIYTVYKNNVRLDDINYDESVDQASQTALVTNPNAVIRSITGDGIQTVINLAGYNPPIETVDGDIIYIRRIDSDGSFTPGDAAFDTQLTGGDLETLSGAYTTAIGQNAGEIVVDGDGFISINNRGPEELVPGTILDTLDIQVYNAVESGQGMINVYNFVADGETVSWQLDEYPQSNSNIIMKIDNVVQDSSVYEFDYQTKTLSISDSSLVPANSIVSILTIGNNGNDILDSDTFIGDGYTTAFETGIAYQTPISAFITVDGIVYEEGYNLIASDNNRITIDFGGALGEGSIITYTIYAGTTQKYSQIVVDKTFDITDDNLSHTFQSIGFPFNERPVADKILVKKGNTFLNSMYTITYTVTSSRSYDLEAWAIRDVNSIRKEDVVVYLNGEVLNRNYWIYDPINYRVNLLQYNIGVAGDELQINVIKDSEYTFITTQITVVSDQNVNGPTYEIAPGDFVNFEFADSTNVSGRLLNKSIGSRNKETILQLQGYVRDFVYHYPETDAFAIDNISNANPAVLTTTAPHGFTTGDKVQIENVVGMTEVNEKEYFVSVVDALNVELYLDENLTNTLNSIGFTPYTQYGIVSILTANTVKVSAIVNSQVVEFDGEIQSIEYLNTDILSLRDAPDDQPIEIFVFSNHDVNDFSRISYDLDYSSNKLPVESQQHLDRNLLSRGYVRLRKPAIAQQYTWVILNGELLSPEVDYKLTNNNSGLQLNQPLQDTDHVEILQFGANVSEQKFAFRQFKDILNRTHFKRINEAKSYSLARDCNYYDKFIELTSSDGIDEPSPNRSLNIPGVIWVNGERIEYMVKDGNFLRQLTRGTLGTSINNLLTAGTKIYSQGIGENIPYKDEIIKDVKIGDGSTRDFELDFDLWSFALEYYTKFETLYRDPSKTLDEILGNIASNFIDVFVAGRKLRKNELAVFDVTRAQDSTEGDVIVEPEFTVSSNNIITLANTPQNLQTIQIVRKKGKVWNDPDTSLGDSENSIAKFITGATSKLPR